MRCGTGIDPIQLAGRMVVLAGCGVLLIQAAGVHSIFPPRAAPLFYRAYSAGIILPMHEGGHFLFRFFGEVLHSLGGSFWQIMFPLLLFAVALKQRSWWGAVYLALAGVHIIDITSYIYDAPFRSLPLLGGRHVGHDWNFLLIRWNVLHESETISETAYAAGLVIGWGGVAAGIVLNTMSRMKGLTGLWGDNNSP